MSFPLRPLALMFLCAMVAVPFAVAQTSKEPNADDVKALREKYQTEREEAIKGKFPVQSFAKADELVKRAEEAAKAENFKAAVRYIRDARWQIPYLPPGLPPHITRVLGESRMRHADRINALSYGPDTPTVASASRDGTAKVWDLSNGREISTYRGHLEQTDDPTKGGSNVLGVTDIAFHPKEKVVASSCGNQVHLWDPATGKQVKMLLNIGKTDKPIKAISYSPDGKLLAVGGDDGILRVVESDSGKAVYTSPSRNARIEKVVFSPNGKLVALGDSNMQVAVYAPMGKGNQLAMSVQGVDLGEVMGVAFSADSSSVFTCGRDGKARLIAGPTPDGSNAPNTATRLKDFTGHSGSVTGLTVTTDGQFLITCGDDKTVRVWEVKTGKQLRAFQGHMTKITAVAVRGDGRQIASGSDDGAVRVWDLNTIDEHRAMTDSKDSLWAVAISPDGKRLATAGADKKIRLYSLPTAKLEVTLDTTAAMTALAFLPDSNRLAAGGGDKMVKIWDIAEKKVVQDLPASGLAVLALDVSDDGKLVVSGSADSTVRGYDPNSGKEFWKWSSRKAACGVSIRKGGKQVAVGIADGTLAVLDIASETPKELGSQVAHVAGVSCVAYSPDGNRLASVGGDGALRVWTVNENGTLTQLVKFEGQPTTGTSGYSPLSTVAFSPDNRYVAAAGADGVVRVWDVQTKSEVRGLRGNTDWVTSIAFTPDGRYLASVAAEKDNTVRLFELPALDNTTAAGGHVRAVNAVAVSPDGKFIATASTDETIKVWDIATGKEVSTLIGNADTPFAIAFLGNDTLVMGGSLSTRDTGRLHYWSTTPPRLLRSVATGEVYTVIRSPDGTKIGAWATRPAVGDSVKNNTYELYTAKGDPISSYTDKGRNVRAATFSPDLLWAIAGDETGGVQIFDLEKKERIGGNLPLFERSVVDLGITPDKKFVVAADDEGMVKVAELKNGKMDIVAKGQTHKSGVRTLNISPTGKTFVTISNDREVKLWSLTDLKPESLTELRSWVMPVTVNGVAYTPDGKSVVTANADGTAYVLELP